MPDSAMARGATERVRATESALMFHHAQRAFLFGALTGYRENMVFDMELLYVGAMFHNVGLNSAHRRSLCRYEVDSANAARDFMREHRGGGKRDRRSMDGDCIAHDAGHSRASRAARRVARRGRADGRARCALRRIRRR